MKNEKNSPRSKTKVRNEALKLMENNVVPFAFGHRDYQNKMSDDH